MELLPLRKTSTLNKTLINITTIIALGLILFVFIRLNTSNPIPQYSSPLSFQQEKCDIFTGEWVPNPDAPYYTNSSCWAIHEHQNCMKHGRPDSEYLKWKWKPNGCDLDIFDPFRFLDIVRGKALAFVGDSVGRNQFQSMICLLSREENPIDVSPTTHQGFKRWKYINYNFTIAFFWSPFLIRSNEPDFAGPIHNGLFNLYLDELDESWTSHIHEFDYIILNAGHWFPRSAIYYENHHVVGCHYCNLPNFTNLPATYAYSRAFRTALRAINEMESFNGIAFMRTFTPSHYEGGVWNAGGNCVRRRPYRSNETILEGMNLDMYNTQLEEFRVVERESKKTWRLMNTTRVMLMRPDGHPSGYGHWPGENATFYNDCIHWCLPGPIDSWADLLLHMIDMELRK